MYLCLSCLTQRKVILDIPCCDLLFRLSVSAYTLFLCIMCHYTNFLSQVWGILKATQPPSDIQRVPPGSYFFLCTFLHSSLSCCSCFIFTCRLDIDDWTFSATVSGSDAFYSQMLTMGSIVPVLLIASPTLSSRSKACQAGTASMR